MSVVPVKSLQSFKEIINKDEYTVFDFWATWCGPCRVISPIFEELSKKISHVKFFKVDVDDQPEIAQEVGIRAMPTFILFKNGIKVHDLIGADPNGLQTLLKKAE